MGNNKTGFNFYNVDTDRYQDRKIKRLKKDFGCNGIAVYDYLLCEIYRVRGCFLEWDESTAFDVAEYFGLKESVVDEIVNYCCAVGLFNKELLASGSVLTSQSIQKRYLEMCVRAKRKNCGIPEKIKLTEEHAKIPENSGSLEQNSGSLSQNSGDLTQSRVEYRKEDKSKEELNEVVNSEIERVVLSFGDCQGGKSNDIKKSLNKKNIESSILYAIEKIEKATNDQHSTGFWLTAIKVLGKDRTLGILYEFEEQMKARRIENRGAYLTKMLQEEMTRLNS